MKIFYLPQSSCELSTEALRESMRRWHWRQYFLNLRRERAARNRISWSEFAPEAAAMYHHHALYHQDLARSIQQAGKVQEFVRNGKSP